MVLLVGLFAAIVTRGASASAPPVTHPAALPKLVLDEGNCIDMFGMGVTGGGTNGSRALLDEQEAAGDPAANGVGTRSVTSTYMPGYTTWQYPMDASTRDPSFNGGVKVNTFAR